ncbi:MAG: FHA domain-containing protein [Deltaproteobacteria bacterium]|nr:FHA domain-containing protein [Deltaproteobacteria bacterium]
MARHSDTPTEPGPHLHAEGEADTLKITRWKLLRGKQEIRLKVGTQTMGRGFDNDIVIESAGASRLHARLHVSLELVTIEDAGSTNGVFINGERIKFSHDLVEGDRILIGTVEYVVADTSSNRPDILPSSEPASPKPSDAPRDTPVAEDPSAWRSSPPADQEEEEVDTTEKCDAIATLGRLADRMLVMGRTDAAVRILGGHLRSVLDAVRRNEKLDEATLRGATQYGMKLTGATNDGRWIDYVIDLHLTIGRLMEPETVRQIQMRIAQGVCIDQKLLRQYKLVVQELMARGDEFDRMIGEMILGLGDE